MAPIGERTHRVFLAFLALNGIASTYYFVNLVHYFAWLMERLSPRIPWTASPVVNVALGGYVLLITGPFGSVFTVLLGMIAIVLWFFLLQQCYFVSKNITQIELEKIDQVKEKWKKECVKKTYVHAYSKGFVQNWIDFFWPPVVKKQKPRDYRREIAEYNKKAKQQADQEKKAKAEADLEKTKTD
jgi:hypothetical protein